MAKSTELMTLAEVAARMGWSPRTLQRRLDEKSLALRPICQTGRPRFRRVDVDRLLTGAVR